MTKIFFDHFPKTAGTSLRMFFAESFGEDAVSPPLKGISLASALSLYQQKKVIIGHFSFYPDIHLPKGYVLATILRDPRERTLSEYFFILNNVPSAGTDSLGKLIKQSTLEDVLNNPNLCKRFLNPQAIHYAGLLHPDPASLSESELLRIAKESLDLFHLVGTTEHLPEFIDKMHSLFSFKMMASIKKYNVTFNRGQFATLPLETRKRINELTRVDRSLWEYAGDIFQTRIQAVTIDDLSTNFNHERIDNVDNHLEPIISYDHNTQSIHRDGSIGNVMVAVEGQLGMGGFFLAGELITLKIQFRAMQDIDDLTVGYSIQHESGSHLFGINSRIYGYQLKCKVGSECHVDFVFPIMLGLGQYSINLTMHSGYTHLDRCYFKKDKCATFEVIGFLGPVFEGVVRLMPAMAFGAISDEGKIEAIDVRTREEVFSRLGMSTPEIFDTRGNLAILANIGSISRREQFALGVEISNRGEQTWRGEGNRPVRLSYHWLGENGEIVEFNGHRSPLPGGVICPGQTVRADVMVEAPDCAGNHVLIISLVQEYVCWFEDRGFQPAKITVDILTSPISLP